MKKLLIRAFIAIILSIGLVTSTISIANAEEQIITNSDLSCGAGDIDNLYPNPDDRSKYYHCLPYGLVLMDCPSGLAFDANVDRCEYDDEPYSPVKENTKTNPIP